MELGSVDNFLSPSMNDKESLNESHKVAIEEDMLLEKKPKCVDEKLVKAMERIEIRTRQNIQKYVDLLEIYGNDHVFMKKVTDKQREIRQAVKDERN